MRLPLLAVALCSLVAVPVSAQTVVVTPGDMATSFADVAANPQKWFFFNDENNTIDNTLGTFVPGPAIPPAGTESIEIAVSGLQRRNLATYRFAGTPLAAMTALQYSTYNAAATNPGPADRAGYLQFNVDFNGSDLWQRRMVFLPRDNGTVLQDQWQTWDAIAGGAALWRYSGPAWPGTAVSGATPRTWADILASYPGVRIRVSDPWLGIRIGEPYANGFTGHLDAIAFGTAAGTTTFDFDFSAANPPASKAQCMNGGWQALTNAEGSAFRNQGQCIQFVNTGK